MEEIKSLIPVAQWGAVKEDVEFAVSKFGKECTYIFISMTSSPQAIREAAIFVTENYSEQDWKEKTIELVAVCNAYQNADEKGKGQMIKGTYTAFDERK